MKPYYEDQWVTIYHGDCREILPQLPKVDLVLTDPPYPTDNRFDGDFELIEQASSLIKTELNCWLVADCFRGDIVNHIKAWGWQYEDILVAYVANSMARCRFGFDTSLLSLVFRRGKPKVIARWNNVVKVVRVANAPKFEHPTPKYVGAYRKYIAMLCPKDGTVLDPFSGSGTSAEAAILENRKYIGIEIEEKYCEIAAKRCSQGVFDLR